MKAMIVILAGLFTIASHASTADVRYLTWSCMGSVLDGDETFYEFDYEELVENYMDEPNTIGQSITLRSGPGIVDLYGPTATRTIDLRSAYVCPNTNQPIVTQVNIENLAQSDDQTFRGPLKVEVVQGCGDGVSHIVVKGFCKSDE